MRCVVIERPGVVRVEERPAPTLEPHQVKVRVSACGVCGTDVHIFHGGFRADYPVVPGHEFAGVVEEAGACVTHVRPGDRVTVDPNISCGVCPYCRRGAVHLCRRLTAIGVNLPGGFQEICALPAKQVYQLPGHLPLDEAAFAEPLACCLHGIDRGGVAPGDQVVVLGAGPIGLLMTQLARLAGAAKVIVSELSPRKRELAQQLGADVVVDPLAEDLDARVTAVTEIGADVVFECVGTAQTAAAAVAAARRGGRVVLFGVSPKEAAMEVRPYEVFLNELTLVGSYINPHTHARAIALLAAGRVRVRDLISHRVPLEEFPRAVELAGQKETVKVLVVP
ncbi:MAG: zinc-dependent alcohol dehydrogenase family protein [Armatimonadota bacterium]|nr:zinc-dependent alcohol dehydrogenase family protein [Armatimonadota bacterium]